MWFTFLVAPSGRGPLVWLWKLQGGITYAALPGDVLLGRGVGVDSSLMRVLLPGEGPWHSGVLHTCENDGTTLKVCLESPRPQPGQKRIMDLQVWERQS